MAKKDQVQVVMDTFKKGKLRSSDGKKVTSKEKALAIALSEKRAVEERGMEERTWKGRKRQRPKRA